jgi:hypothetical protein
MANAFDPANAQEGEPYEVVVGDFIQWKRSDLAATYDPTLYDLVYEARITAGGANTFSITATNYNDSFLLTVLSATSANFVAGDYYWQAEIIRKSDSERIVVDRGTFNIIVDLPATGADPRTHAEIMLTKIEALLEGRADGDVSSYSIAGRSLTKMSPAELIEWRDYYRREVLAEKRKNDVKLGRASPATVKVRFS